MYNVTITRFTPIGQLKKYETRKCADNQAIKDFIKEDCPDFYDTYKWTVEKIIHGEKGWIRIAMGDLGQRILVNTFYNKK
jgi:hypothetical protein